MSEHEPQPEQPTLSGEVKSVFRHSAIYMLVPAISKVVGFLLFPIYTTHLTTSDYGIHALIEIAMMFSAMVMAINLATAMTRFYYAVEGSAERNQVVSTVYLAMLMIGLPVLLTLIASGHAIANMLKLDVQYVSLLRWGLTAAWLGAIVEIGFSFLRMRYMAKTFLIGNLSQLFLVIGFNILFVVFWQWGIAGIVFALVFAQGIVGSILTALILSSVRTVPSFATLGKLVRFGIPLVPSSLTQQLNNYVHPVMLQWLAAVDPIMAATHVGIYAVGQKIAVVVNRFVIMPFNSFWMPRRMELVMQDESNSDRIIARICTYSTMMTAAFALLLSSTCESVLQWMSELGLVSDPAYLDAHWVIPLIALSYTIHSLEHHFTTGLMATGNTKPASIIGIVSFAILFSLNVVLIPRIGFMGAAFATFAGTTVRTGMFLMVSRTNRPIRFEFHRLGLSIAIAIALYLTTRMVRFESTTLTLASHAVMALLYLPLCYAIGLFDATEVAKMRRSFSHLKSRLVAQKGTT